MAGFVVSYDQALSLEAISVLLDKSASQPKATSEAAELCAPSDQTLSLDEDF
jgi:hypothetical protein